MKHIYSWKKKNRRQYQFEGGHNLPKYFFTCQM